MTNRMEEGGEGGVGKASGCLYLYLCTQYTSRDLMGDDMGGCGTKNKNRPTCKARKYTQKIRGTLTQSPLNFSNINVSI